MVAKYYGQSYSAQELRERTQIGKEEVIVFLLSLVGMLRPICHA
ncbi:hypothetical protein [Runella sp.]|nr:hypothetical protein [Runella sp.]